MKIFNNILYLNGISFAMNINCMENKKTYNNETNKIIENNENKNV